MNKIQILAVFCFFALQNAVAQQDTIYRIDVVEISDIQLKNNSNSQNVITLNDSVIRKNRSSLTQLLNQNSVIYFKENGLGMVSSPSFRGTTAQQTAVIWNGININSQLNGQTDFNTINTSGFNEIAVRSGGGSAIYGSSAIGGSVHLNNNLNFSDFFENQIRVRYGSFNTIEGDYKIAASNEKFSVEAGISRISSDNDYDFPERSLKNENGQFYNHNFFATAGYKMNNIHTLKVYSQLFDGERHFSGAIGVTSRNKYQDVNSRNMLEWIASSENFSSKTKLAYLREKYKYFEDFTLDNFTFGEAKTFIARHDFIYDLSEKIQLNSILEYNETNGSGSDIQQTKRKIGAASLLMKHKVLRSFYYEISARKEFTNTYESPFLFSAGTVFQPADFYRLKLNFSRNFRIPTFNDLYWQGSGNPNLLPESSYQGEIGNEIIFGKLKFTATGFFINIENMLRWSPGQNGLWTPNNVAEVKTYGAEILASWQKKSGNHVLDLNASYAYTVSEDQKISKQLIYVPFHKMTASAAYSYKNFSTYAQFLGTGEVFTSSDNENVLDGYAVANAGFSYSIKQNYTLGFDVLNVFEENYQSTLNRPMPGRNFNISLTINF